MLALRANGGLCGGGTQKAGTRKIDEFLENNAIKPFIDAEVIERAKNVIPIFLKINVLNQILF